MSRGPALWTGDAVSGHNRFTDELVSGELLKLEAGIDGVKYAEVQTADGVKIIEARALRGAPRCFRPDPDWDRRDKPGACRGCGRQVYEYPNGADITMTHRADDPRFDRYEAV